jgi:hypothetical protein
MSDYLTPKKERKRKNKKYEKKEGKTVKKQRKGRTSTLLEISLNPFLLLCFSFLVYI